MSEQKIVRVRDVMKTGFDLVDGLDDVAHALRNARHPDTKCLLVKKRDANDEYGIVTYADIAKQVLARDRAPERVNIYEIMTKPVLGVPPVTDVTKARRPAATRPQKTSIPTPRPDTLETFWAVENPGIRMRLYMSFFESSASGATSSFSIAFFNISM